MPQSLKERLASEPEFRAYGAFLMAASPLVAELMAKVGYDFLVVDLEHSPLGLGQTALQMLQAVEAGRASALLRVALNRPELIKKALDLGPAGLVVPLVNSAQEAAEAARACRYPPQGIRGVANPLVRASGWGLDAAYAHEYRDRCLLLVQVETVAALEAVDAILETEGVDGVFVGPLDLAAALGHFGEPGHADVRSALAKIEEAAARHPEKLLAGFSGGRPVSEMLARGYRLVASSADVALLREAAKADVLAAREALQAPAGTKRAACGTETSEPDTKKARSS